MLWFWKLLGYKDEEKEMIKRHQLEIAQKYFTESEKTIEIPLEIPKTDKEHPYKIGKLYKVSKR